MFATLSLQLLLLSPFFPVVTSLQSPYLLLFPGCDKSIQSQSGHNVTTAIPNISSSQEKVEEERVGEKRFSYLVSHF